MSVRHWGGPGHWDTNLAGIALAARGILARGTDLYGGFMHPWSSGPDLYFLMRSTLGR
ncbi:MAG TPA: hypothetical protein VIM10_11105 [Actinopolymorphaceae bacterium]